MSGNRGAAAAALALTALVSTQANAQAQRTFVASYGTDASLCGRSDPCRSFATAIGHTATQGEIVVLDSAGYGPVFIDKAVSIIAPPGVYAGISVTGPDGGVVVAAGGDDRVALRGLTINGLGGASGNGIAVSTAAEVSIENCIITNMTGSGISVYSLGGATRIQIRNVLARGNGGAGLWVMGGGGQFSVQVADSQFVLNGTGPGSPSGGIEVSSGALTAQRIVVSDNATFGVIAASEFGDVSVTVSDSEISRNGYGGGAFSEPIVGGNATLTVVRSTVAANGGNGLLAGSTGGAATVTLVVSDSAVTDNAAAGVMAAAAQANVLVTRSTVARNVGPDLLNSAGVLRSGGNNTLTGRGPPDVQGSITVVAPQ